MVLKNTFGETIKALRNERHLTLREVAAQLGIGTSMLGKIERNTRKPTFQFIEKISKLYKIEDKLLKVAFLSDSIVYSVTKNEELASEALKVAEKKVKYLTKKKKS